MGAIFCFFPAILMSSTFSDKNDLFFFSMKKQAFPIRHFFPSKFHQPSSNCLIHNRPASGYPYQFRSRRTTGSSCPYKFRSRGTTGSSMFDHDFGHCVVEDVSKNLDILTYGILSNVGSSSIFTRVYDDMAPAACSSSSGSLALTPITYAAVICDADEPALFSTDCMGSRVVFCNVTSEFDSSCVLLNFPNSAFLR